jgi:Terminase large subunit, T4likevirus-type, N-terminal
LRKSKIEKWQEQHRAAFDDAHLSSIEDLIKLMADGARPKAERQINPAQLDYINSDARYKMFMGPAGSGKSVAGVLDIVLRALLFPGSKWFIARRDYNDLKDTTLRTFNRILEKLPADVMMGRQKEPPMKVLLRPILAPASDIPMVPSEITFMGLSDQIRGYEFCGGFIDEVDEVERVYVEELKGRMRYVPWAGFPENAYSMGMACNPPAKAHWLYTAATGKDSNDERVQEPWIKTFRPAPKDNQRNLRAGYYEDMMASMPEELRQRLVDGEWGSVFPGDPVVRQFNRKLHVDPDIKWRGRTAYRFWDFGYNHPCTLLSQISKRGHVEIVAECMGTRVEAKQFVPEVAKLTNTFAEGALDTEDYGDPAVKQHKDTGSALAVFADAGIRMRFKHTPFDLSMKLLRSRFELMLDGKPAITIHPRCRILIEALGGGYHFKSDGVTPFKDNYYDHLPDALRYGIWNIFGTSLTSADADQLPSSVAYWSR